MNNIRFCHFFGGMIILTVLCLTWHCEGRAWFRNPMGPSGRNRVATGNAMDYYRYRKTVDMDPIMENAVPLLPPLLFPPASRSLINARRFITETDSAASQGIPFVAKRGFGWGPSAGHIGSWREDNTAQLGYQQARDSLKEKAMTINMLCSYFSSVSCLGRRSFPPNSSEETSV